MDADGGMVLLKEIIEVSYPLPEGKEEEVPLQDKPVTSA
jgi:hypothetical protein